MTLLREVRLPRRTPAAPAADRALGVDALRGLAILGMVLVAVQPPAVLPVWMYHAQTPPPSHEMNTAIAGLTWPDLVFPFFIVTLGIAIPLALARRLDGGSSAGTILLGALGRGALLLFFALFRQHFDSTVSGLAPASTAWLAALGAFAVLCLVFLRFPPSWPMGVRIALRGAGWTGAAVMFALIRFPDGSTVRPDRIDIILLVLASCAVFGTATWVFTRHNVLARLGVLAMVSAAWLAGDHSAWVSGLYLQFLCAVIPGTIVGDLLLERARGGGAPDAAPRMAPGHSWALIATLCTLVPIVVTGVQARALAPTIGAVLIVAAAALLLLRRPVSLAEMFNLTLIRWGTFWLVLGLVLDPAQGGTKKVPETFAWFFQGSGLAILLLVACMTLTDVLRRPAILRPLIEVGQNPMVAYVAVGMLLVPILGLTGLQPLIDAQLLSPWSQFGWSVTLTAIVTVVVQQATRRRLIWRS